jgi:FYVE/RhoGEF/PH domain-containing protein 5/6
MAIDREPPPREASTVIHEEEATDLSPDKRGRVKLKSHHSRPRSYHQILEDFQDMDQGRSDVLNLPLEEGEDEDHEEENLDHADYLGLRRESSLMSTGPISASSSPRREDTARRNKRFSLPAVSLQTTSVTARTGFGDGEAGTGGNSASQLRPNKRFSLVLGGSRHHGQGGSRSQSEMTAKVEEGSDGKGKGELGKGVAAGKLSELLGRKKD